MTKITYCIGKYAKIKICGHAGAERVNGNDLCCAAESMLAYTLIDTINGLKLSKCDMRINSGYVYISFVLNSLRSVFALCALKTIINGYLLLCTKYPDNVSVEKKKEVTCNEQIFN